MSDRHVEIFPELSPPPGGLDGLRQRLDESGEIRSGRRYPALAFATLAVICLVLWVGDYWPGKPGGSEESLRNLAQASRDGNPVLVKFGLVAEPGEPVTLAAGERGRAALDRVAVGDPRVVYYRFSVLDEPGLEAEGETEF